MVYSPLKLFVCCFILVAFLTGCSFQDAENMSPAPEESRQGKRVAVIDIEEMVDASVVPGMGDDHGFRFIRIIYRDWNNRWMWATDYPTADDNLQEAIGKTTLTTSAVVLSEAIAVVFHKRCGHRVAGA